MLTFESSRTTLYVHERALMRLALINGQRNGMSNHPSPRYVTFRELVNGLDEDEKPCFVSMQLNKLVSQMLATSASDVNNNN